MLSGVEVKMSRETSSGAGGDGGSTAEPIWLGVGSPRPQPRMLQNAMFGHVADAFDGKSIFKIGETPSTPGRQHAAAAQVGPESGRWLAPNVLVIIVIIIIAFVY